MPHGPNMMVQALVGTHLTCEILAHDLSYNQKYVRVLKFPFYTLISMHRMTNLLNMENGFLENLIIYFYLKLLPKFQHGLKVAVGSLKQFCIKFLQNPDW